MIEEHFIAECSCSGNGTNVGIGHTVFHCNQMILAAHVHIKCILKRLVLFRFTVMDSWCEENDSRQFC